MVEDNKLFSWLRLRLSKKSTITGDKVEGSSNVHHHDKHGNQGLRHTLWMYGRRGWMRHWKHLHLDNRSCAQTKDVCIACPRQSHNPKLGLIRTSMAEQIVGVKIEPSAQRKNEVNLLDLEENSRKEGVIVKEGANFMGRISSGDLDVSGFELLHHKSGLKNRVLPLTSQEDSGFSATFKVKTTLFRVDEEGPIPEMDSEIWKQKGLVPFKKVSFSRISSTPVSPRSPSETKWKMLLSCSSQAGSPRSPVCLHTRDWKSAVQEGDCWIESVSTMGSPWNSQAGGNRYQANKVVSIKGLYKQGQWVTTDSDFVVLEL